MGDDVLPPATSVAGAWSLAASVAGGTSARMSPSWGSSGGGLPLAEESLGDGQGVEGAVKRSIP